MFRALLPRFLLIAALLFAQLGGLAHGISHTLDDHGADSSLSHEKHCDLCAEYAQMGSAISSNAIQFSLPERGSAFAVALPVSFRSGTFIAYPARAPPRSA